MKTLSRLFLLLLLLPMSLTAQQNQEPVKAMPGIVAHRGFHRFEGSAENTISSMRHAVDHDFEGTEFDVQITVDGVDIVYHDANMQGHVICNTPYDTLRQLPAFTLKSGETVPLLTDFLDACSKALREQEQRGKHTELFFEIKPLERKEQRYHLLGQIIEAIGKAGLHDDIFFISFDLDACMMLSQLMPDVHVAYLEGDLSPKQLQEKGITDIDYHWSKFDAHPEWVKEAHDLGMVVGVWTVNTPEKAQEMLQLGVDYITTDYPYDMRSWLEMEKE